MHGWARPLGPGPMPTWHCLSCCWSVDFLRNLFSQTLGLGSQKERLLDELSLEGVTRYMQSERCESRPKVTSELLGMNSKKSCRVWWSVPNLSKGIAFQGWPQLCCVFKANLSYMRAFLK